MTTDQLIGEAVRALALAAFPEWTAHKPEAVRRDPNARRHRLELLAALKGREACGVYECREFADEDGWCGTHAPDEAAIIRATRGDAVELMPHERTEAVRRMNAQGMSAAQIARMLHVTRRTVERHVAKVRAAA